MGAPFIDKIGCILRDKHAGVLLEGGGVSACVQTDMIAFVVAGALRTGRRTDLHWQSEGFAAVGTLPASQASRKGDGGAALIDNCGGLIAGVEI
jgi:hypothetical protein